MTEPLPAGTAALKPELVTMTHIIYALYAASFFVGISAIVAIVMNYVKRDDVRGTYLESHLARSQISMFWFGLSGVSSVACSPSS